MVFKNNVNYIDSSTISPKWCKDTNVVCGKIQRYNEVKKNLESCYKTHFFFHIRTIKQRHIIKYIYDTKNINIYFSLLGVFFVRGLLYEGLLS